MRMRHKPNLTKRIAECEGLLFENPEGFKGDWRKALKYEKMALEIGCGKGAFTCDIAEANPDILFIALEKVTDAMVTAMERVRDREIKNVYFIDGDAANINDMFDTNEVDIIYINFCDPWPKSRDAKFRLTAPSFLRSYADILPIGGEIRFKTDNLPLFEWSIDQFKAEGWTLRDITNDLHASGISDFMTDYEIKFMQQGVPINRLTALRREDTFTRKAGTPERLRNASLSDARGNAK